MVNKIATGEKRLLSAELKITLWSLFDLLTRLERLQDKSIRLKSEANLSKKIEGKREIAVDLTREAQQLESLNIALHDPLSLADLPLSDDKILQQIYRAQFILYQHYLKEFLLILIKDETGESTEIEKKLLEKNILPTLVNRLEMGDLQEILLAIDPPGIERLDKIFLPQDSLSTHSHFLNNIQNARKASTFSSMQPPLSSPSSISSGSRREFFPIFSLNASKKNSRTPIKLADLQTTPALILSFNPSRLKEKYDIRKALATMSAKEAQRMLTQIAQSIADANEPKQIDAFLAFCNPNSTWVWARFGFLYNPFAALQREDDKSNLHIFLNKLDIRILVPLLIMRPTLLTSLVTETKQVSLPHKRGNSQKQLDTSMAMTVATALFARITDAHSGFTSPTIEELQELATNPEKLKEKLRAYDSNLLPTGSLYKSNSSQAKTSVPSEIDSGEPARKGPGAFTQ